MKKKCKIIITSIIVLLSIISIGVYSVLAENKFDAKIEANDLIVNKEGEEIIFTVSSENIEETGLSAGTFYIEYNSNVFSVSSSDEIKYLQNETNFSYSKTEEKGKGKIIILYDDNSLKKPLLKGNLFSITMTIKNMSELDRETIVLSGEGFGTIKDNKIIEVTGNFENETITFRERDILVNNLIKTNGEMPIYNGEISELTLNVIGTDIDKENNNEVIITRTYKYGDINIDGKINEKDLEILRKIKTNDIKLTNIQNVLADLNNDGQIDDEDSNLLEFYLSDWENNTLIGKINKDLSKIYYYGDIDLNGIVDEEDLNLFSQYFSGYEKAFTETQLLLADLTKDDQITRSDLLKLSKYFEYKSEAFNVGKLVDGTNLYYGDLYLDEIIDHKDLELLKMHLDSEKNFVLSDTQKIVADINKDNNIDKNDLNNLEEYYNNLFRYSIIGKTSELSTLYYYGDIDLNGVIDVEDGVLAFRHSLNPELYSLNAEQLNLLQITSGNLAENVEILQKYLATKYHTNHRIGLDYDSNNKIVFGDADLDGRINNNDLVTIEKIYKGEIEYTNRLKLNLGNKENLPKVYDLIKVKLGLYGEFDTVEKYITSFYENIGVKHSTMNIVGDVNFDDKYDRSDLLRIVNYFNGLDVEIDTVTSDVNFDDKVDLADLNLINATFSGHTKDSIIKNYLEDYNKIEIESTNLTNKYGDLNLDGKIDSSDLELIANYDELTGQAYLNRLPFEYVTTYFTMNLYLQDLTDTEIIRYIDNSLNRIGTKSEDDNLIGDVNLDGIINSFDEAILAKSFSSKWDVTLNENSLELADIDGNGKVNISDLCFLVKYLSNWDKDSIFQEYKVSVKYINRQTPEYVNDKFTIETTEFNDESITIQNFSLTTKDTIETGIYNVVVSSNNESQTIMSNTYSFAVEPKPVSEITFDKESYTVGIGCEEETNHEVLPKNAFNKNVSYSIKDTNIATVDENGVVTGVSKGETYLYINSMDGSIIQSSTKIIVVEKVIAMGEELKFNPSIQYPIRENEINSFDGGEIITDISLINVEETSLRFNLIKSENNNQTNIYDNSNVKAKVVTDNSETKLVITIPNDNALEPGMYDFKIVEENGIESNTIHFEIKEFIPVTNINIKYGDNNLDSLTIIKDDTIELNNVLNENATNTKVKWGLTDVEGTITEVDHDTVQIKITGNTNGKIYAQSEENETVKKEININIINPTSEKGIQEKSSNVGNPEIDEKFGGYLIQPITFNNLESTPIINSVEMFNSQNTKIEGVTWEKIENEENSINLKINIEPNKLNAGNYTVKYKYNINDTKRTIKEDKFTINIEEYIPVTSITSDVTEMTIVMGTKNKISGININPSNATYQDLKYETNAELISVNETGEITTNRIGNAIVTISSKDNEEIKTTININVIEHDLTSDKHLISINENKITRINDKLTHKTLMDNITKYSNNITTKLFKDNNELDDSKLIGTGSILKTYLNDDLLNEYKMIVSGDLNGDGKILTNDISLTRMHILEMSTLEGIFYEAGDINLDGRVNTTDILRMRMYILEISDNVWGN